MALKMLLVYFTEEKSRFLTKEWTKCAYVCVCMRDFSSLQWSRIHSRVSADMETTSHKVFSAKKVLDGAFQYFRYTFRFGCETAGDLFCQYKPGRVLINSASSIQKKNEVDTTVYLFYSDSGDGAWGLGEKIKLTKKTETLFKNSRLLNLYASPQEEPIAPLRCGRK